MSTLKYDADGFCSDWRRSSCVRAGMLKSSVVPPFEGWILSLKNVMLVSRSQNISLHAIWWHLHIYQLLVRQNIVEILSVLDAEAKLCRIGIVGEYTNNTSREWEHHVTRHFDLTSRFIAAAKECVYDFMKCDCKWNSLAHSNGQRWRTSRAQAKCSSSKL